MKMIAKDITIKFTKAIRKKKLKTASEKQSNHKEKNRSMNKNVEDFPSQVM